LVFRWGYWNRKFFRKCHQSGAIEGIEVLSDEFDGFILIL
jgi:hypothetical protein